MTKELSKIVFDLPNRRTLIRRAAPCVICGEINAFGYYTFCEGERVYVCVRHELIEDYKPSKKKFIKGD